MATFQMTIKVAMACKVCHSNEGKHKANGMCTKCYLKKYYQEYWKRKKAGDNSAIDTDKPTEV